MCCPGGPRGRPLQAPRRTARSAAAPITRRCLLVRRWERPSIALAGPAVAAASAAKSGVVPFEATHRLMELQMGVLLLSLCHLVRVVPACCGGSSSGSLHRRRAVGPRGVGLSSYGAHKGASAGLRLEGGEGCSCAEHLPHTAHTHLSAALTLCLRQVVVLCDGLDDAPTWEFLQATEMLARGVPDPTLPHLPGQPAAQQAQQAQHLADVLLLHVVDAPGGGSDGCGGGLPGQEEVACLEQRARAYFAPSRLSQPGVCGCGEDMGAQGSACCCCRHSRRRLRLRTVRQCVAAPPGRPRFQ